MTIKVGDQVTCLYKRGVYWPSPEYFEPGEVGLVVGITPKVVMRKGEGYDNLPDFLIVDCRKNGRTERVSLNFCNAVKV